MGWLLQAIIFLLVSGELFCFYIYHSFYSIRIVQLIAETNRQESLEFIRSKINWSASFAPLCYIFSSIAAILLILYIGRLFRSKASHTVKTIAKVTLLCIILWAGKNNFACYNKLRWCFRAEETSVFAHFYGDGFQTPATRFLYGYAYNLVASSEMSILAETLRNTEVKSCNFECPLIVLVIGESFSKYHTPLYTDCENTSPRLLQLQADSSLVVFSDIIAPSNLTSNVMKKLFSIKTHHDSISWTRLPLFTTAFLKAGYNVHLHTNQFSLSDDDDFNLIGGTIFNNPVLSELQFSHRNDSLYTYDEELIDHLPDTDTLYQCPTLLIVHLMGQHVEYDRRYPPEFSYFTPDSMVSMNPEVSAAYANATLYNDYVIDKLWSRLKNLDAVCLYFSDHGEECYDWRNLHERTDESFIIPEIAKYQFEVPYMFLMSDEFKANHPAIAQQIWDAKDRPGMNCDASHVLLYLAGIDIDGYQEHKNILSPSYDSSQPRYLVDHLNYDLMMQRYYEKNMAP